MAIGAFIISTALAAGPICGQITTRVSVSSGSDQGDRESCCPSISADGRFVAFGSFARTLVPGDGNRVDDVFIRDRMTRTTRRMSVDSAGAEGNGATFLGALSASGRFVAFQSLATNLVSGDTNAVLDVFVRDRDPDGNGVFDELNGATILVSVGPAGEPANGVSDDAAIPENGRWVVFHSTASNLLATQPGDTNGASDVFVRDLVAGTTIRVSLRTSGAEGNGDSRFAALSADARYVAFHSLASNLVANDTNNSIDVFLHDIVSGITRRVSVDALGGQANGHSLEPSISADSRFVAFQSIANDLVSGDANGVQDVFVHDRDVDADGTFDEPSAVATTRVSVNSSGAPANGSCSHAQISSDGNCIAFQSAASNLVIGDTNGLDDVFVRDLSTGETIRVSVDSIGGQADDVSSGVSISADGRLVAYESRAENLVPGDSNGRADIFSHDRAACAAGSVDTGSGSPVDVLRVNGSTGLVIVARGSPVGVTLDTALRGPLPGRYTLWIWRTLPAYPVDVVVLGEILGCTVNPTPFHSGAVPQPFMCLRGGFGPGVCAGTRELANAPTEAPWMMQRNRGFARSVALTLQGMLEDAGAGNSVGTSITNAVVLSIE